MTKIIHLETGTLNVKVQDKKNKRITEGNGDVHCDTDKLVTEPQAFCQKKKKSPTPWFKMSWGVFNSMSKSQIHFPYLAEDKKTYI